MPVAEGTTARPAFVDQILAGGDDKKALAILERVHPEYSIRRQAWQVLLDAYEGSGGFLDGAYLWPYPRESAESFFERKAMARYHNYVETPIDLYVRFVFQGVQRTSKNEEFNDWCQNVDGKGTTLDALLKRYASVALVHGHAGCLIDRTAEEPSGPSKADEQARTIAAIFTALSIPDWRYSREGLQAVKLIEAADAVGIAEELPEDESAIQYLLWDKEGWARFAGTGELKSAGVPGLGLVPLVLLQPKPVLEQNTILGRALIGNPNVPRALYNRASEEDEVLRAQAFSLFVVTVPPDGNVDTAKQDLGREVGTTKAIVVRANSATYETPDQSVAENIRNNQVYLAQELFRSVHVRFKRDTAAVESGESKKLENGELNEALQGLAKSLAQAEQEIFRCWCAWESTSPEQAEQMFEAAEFTVIYPDEYFLEELQTELDAWAEAIRLDLGETMTKRIKKRAALRIEPNMPEDVKDQVIKEIDEQEVVSETERARAEMDAMKQAFDNGDPEGQGIQNAN